MTNRTLIIEPFDKNADSDQKLINQPSSNIVAGVGILYTDGSYIDVHAPQFINSLELSMRDLIANTEDDNIASAIDSLITPEEEIHTVIFFMLNGGYKNIPYDVFHTLTLKMLNVIAKDILQETIEESKV